MQPLSKDFSGSHQRGGWSRWLSLEVLGRRLRAVSLLFLAALISLCCSGCTTLLSQGGKDLDRVFSATNSQAQIRHALGQPTEKQAFREPVAASAIPELASRLRFREELSPETLIGGCDDIAFRGRIYNPDGEGLAFMNTFLPIVGEIIFFPFAVAQAVTDSRQIHRFCVWYRVDERYFAHIRLPESRK